MEIGFIDHFTTRLVNASNYNAITDFHTFQITTAHTNPSQSITVSTSRFLVTASNSEGSSTSALTSLHAGSQLHRLSLPFTDSFCTLAQIVLLITSRHGPRRKHSLFLYSNRFRGNMFVCESVTQ
jgi:D-alanyl-lipoteichoic acid acyltransferase DltB (MBOAT superfamily)